MHRDRRLVLLAGEPGVGKTRLAHEFAARGARGRRHRPARPLLGGAARALRAVRRGAAPGRRRRRAAARARPPERTPARRHRLFDAVDAALADRAPLLLVIDDLHWADRGTLLLASFLLRSARPGPLLLVGTYRDTELGRRSPLTGALADLQRDGALDRIGAARPRRGRRRRARARRCSAATRSPPRVHARTGGNAFFVEEVLRGLAEARHAGGAGERAPRRRRPAVAARATTPTSCSAAAAILGLELDAVRAAGDRRARARRRRGRARRGPARAAAAAGRDAAALRVRPRARARGGLARAQRAAPRAAAPARGRGAGRARRGPPPRGDRHATCSRPPTPAAPPRCSSAPAAARSTASPTRTPPSASPARSRRSSSRTPRARPARSCSPAATRCCAPASPAPRARRSRAAAQLARRARRRRAARRGGARVRRARDRDRRPRRRGDRPARGGARGAPRDPRAALAAAGAARGRALLRARPHALGGAQRRGGRDRARRAATRARSPSALNARHVALWRPDRVEERLATAADMIAAAREAGERHAELQARNWRVTDLFELGDMPACREEMARHARLADELRLPVVPVVHAAVGGGRGGCSPGASPRRERLLAEAREAGVRAGDGNAELFADMVEFGAPARSAARSTRSTWASSRTRSPTRRPAPPTPPRTPGCSPARGETERARAAPRRLRRPPARVRRQLAVRAGRVRRGRRRARRPDPRAPSSTSASRPTPAAPRRRAARSTSYGAVDRHLGGLAALLGRRDDAERHLRAAIARNDELGCTVVAAARRAPAARRRRASLIRHGLLLRQPRRRRPRARADREEAVRARQRLGRRRSPRRPTRTPTSRSTRWEEYAAWHLGLTEGANDETKARYAFVYGDFRRLHRIGLIACMYRAAEWRHKEVELAAHELLQELDRATL